MTYAQRMSAMSYGISATRGWDILGIGLKVHVSNQMRKQRKNNVNLLAFLKHFCFQEHVPYVTLYSHYPSGKVGSQIQSSGWAFYQKFLIA